MLCFSTFSVLVAVYVGSKQMDPRFQYPSISTYANLLIVSGFCWGSLLQSYLLWGLTNLIQRIRRVAAAAVTLALVFGVLLPPVMLINTGPMPDDFASWLMATMGAIPGALLTLLIWCLTVRKKRLFL